MLNSQLCSSKMSTNVNGASEAKVVATPDQPAPSDRSHEIEAIKTDIAALRLTIELVKSQYEERMAAIRDSHQAILSQACQEGSSESVELVEEIELMEMKMQWLNSQACGLESALDRYAAHCIAELRGPSVGAKHEGHGDGQSDRL